MPKFFHRSRTIGLPPGTIVTPACIGCEKPEITVFDYDEAHWEEHQVERIEDCFPFRDKQSVTWINIDGIHDAELIQKIDTHFGIHPLVLEDVVSTGQRPKLDDYDEYLFLVMKMVYWGKDPDALAAEQVSVVIGSNYVISFQEKPGDVFSNIRDRIRTGKGRVRKMGADYLAYCLLDAVVDHYFVILERYDNEIEELDETIREESDAEISSALHALKRDLIFLKRQIWPLREVISSLQRSESKLIKKTTGIYLRDVYDNAVQVIDTIESFREMLAGLHDVHLSMMSNRMSQIMKVLTIFSAIFIPLTFIAGVYGMNFDYMPELHSRWGYYVVLGFMALVAAGLIITFKKKKWF
ncbi:MAG TPA: magnesium/cobalt transporter CorA [Candidatus Bathyarchaeia archaeon]|nr:magnesium/cobalt transporter CorA [Candidatus Bathyarchaeia archaeon]